MFQGKAEKFGEMFAEKVEGLGGGRVERFFTQKLCE